MEKINHYPNYAGKSCQSQVGDLFQILQNVKEQVEYDCLTPDNQPAANEICLIIAEVYKLPPQAEIKIESKPYSAEMVQSVYSMLTNEHITLVIDNFSRICYEVKHKKSYLRTALYNSVFELNTHWENRVHADNPQWVKNPFGIKAV